MMNTYILGIFWALGRYVDEFQSPGYPHFFIRHNRRHFMDVVRRDLNLSSNIHTVIHRGKPQYRLKVTGMDFATLERLGWQPRNDVTRGYPRINEHRDFIRAYVEIHSSIDIVTIKKRGRLPYRQPRLRIYGNMQFLTELTEVLATEIGINVMKVQQSTRASEVSGTLYYQSRKDLKAILDYLYRPPLEYFDREHYDRYREVMGLFA